MNSTLLLRCQAQIEQLNSELELLYAKSETTQRDHHQANQKMELLKEENNKLLQENQQLQLQVSSLTLTQQNLQNQIDQHSLLEKHRKDEAQEQNKLRERLDMYQQENLALLQDKQHQDASPLIKVNGQLQEQLSILSKQFQSQRDSQQSMQKELFKYKAKALNYKKKLKAVPVSPSCTHHLKQIHELTKQKNDLEDMLEVKFREIKQQIRHEKERRQQLKMKYTALKQENSILKESHGHLSQAPTMKRTHNQLKSSLFSSKEYKHRKAKSGEHWHPSLNRDSLRLY